MPHTWQARRAHTPLHAPPQSEPQSPRVQTPELSETSPQEAPPALEALPQVCAHESTLEQGRRGQRAARANQSQQGAQDPDDSLLSTGAWSCGAEGQGSEASRGGDVPRPRREPRPSLPSTGLLASGAPPRASRELLGRLVSPVRPDTTLTPQGDFGPTGVALQRGSRPGAQ